MSITLAAKDRQAHGLTELSVPRKDTDTKQTDKNPWLVMRAKQEAMRQRNRH